MSDIAINPVTRRVQFTGNTGTGPYAFTFNILVDGDIAVFKGTTELTLTTDYTVSINANGTGSITLTVALIASDVLTIIGGRELSRTTDFVTAGDLLASSLNEQLDSNVIMTQQLDEKLGRGLFVNPGDVFTDLELPLKDDRKGTVLGFNETTGDPEPGPTLSDVESLANISADIKTLAEIQDGTVATDAITNVNTIRTDVTTVSGISGNVTTVAGISSDVTTVAADGTDIGLVAGSISNVNNVGGSISNVNTVAGSISNVNTVSGDIADVNTVAGISSDVSTVSGISADVTTVAADGTDIGVVAGISSDVTTVSGISANVTTVAGINAAVSTVAADQADIGVVSTNIASVNTVSINIASVNTNTANITAIQNASANASAAATSASNAATSESNAATSESNAATSASDADTARIAAEAALDEFTDIYLGAKASDPTTDNDGNALTAGDQYFNTTINVLKIYNGSAWQAAAIDSSGFVETTGDTMTGNLSFGDNDKAIFGAGSDLQIFHTGSYSAIRDVGTGGLFIGGENYVDIGNAGASATYARFHKDAQVDLYHNNSVKLATSASGIDISGTVTADGLTVDGTSILDSETNFVPDTYSSNKSLVLSSQGATGGNGQLGASVAFSRINTESPRAAIAAINTDSNFERMGLSFWTHQDNFANVMKKRMQIDHEGDISFYEDTGTTAKLTWDASAQSLSVDGPITADGLAVHGDGTFSATTDVSFTLKSTSGALSQGQVLGKINFFNSDPSSFGPNNAAVIEAIAFGVSGNAAELNFRTNNSITEGADAAKTMSLNAFGDISFYDSTGTTPKFFWDASAESLGIGESSPASYGKLTLLDGATRFWITESTSNEMMLSVGASERMLFGINNTEAMRIDSSGHAIIPAGVTLGTAAGVYAAANTLDDYEEGTWTPVLGGSSGTSGQTYAKQVGLYTKIGNTVHAQCYVQLSAEGTVSGSLILDGLPFASANVTDAYGAGCISQFVNLGSNVVDMSLRTNVNASYAFVFGLAAAATGSGALSAPTYLTNSTIIAASLTYKAA